MIEEIETLIEEVETRLYNIRLEKISADNVYQFLLFFDKLYDRFTRKSRQTVESFVVLSSDSLCFSMGKRYTNWIGTTKVPLRRLH